MQTDCGLVSCTSEVEQSICNQTWRVLQVLERANKNEYGLAAGVWAKGEFHSGDMASL